MTVTDKQNEFVCISYGSGYVELFMTLEQVESIATIGENDLAVEEVSKDPIIKKQFEQYSDEIIEKAFKDIGIEEQGRTFTREEQEQYILWSMAWTHVDVDEVIDEITDNVHGIEDVVCQYTEDFKHELDIKADPDEFKYYELEYYVDENIGDCELIDSWEY